MATSLHLHGHARAALLITGFTMAFVSAGCGLTLDYDPPEDAGIDAPGLDAPVQRLDAPALDAGCNCPAGEVCDLEGICVVVSCVDANVDCAGLPPPACGGGYECVDGRCAAPSPPSCATPECGTFDGCCVGTPNDDDCVDDDVCDPSTLLCVGCLADPDCAMGCDTTAQRCICANDSDCASPRGLCIGGLCEACTSDGDCTGRAAPYCNVDTGSCIACDATHMCRAGLTCNEGRCVDCMGDGDCARGEFCDMNRCIECNLDQPCTLGTCEAGRCVVGPTNPVPEICGNGFDDDGDGAVDDGCAPCVVGLLRCDVQSVCESCVGPVTGPAVVQLYYAVGGSSAPGFPSDAWRPAPLCPREIGSFAVATAMGRFEVMFDVASRTVGVVGPGGRTSSFTLPLTACSGSSFGMDGFWIHAELFLSRL